MITRHRLALGFALVAAPLLFYPGASPVAARSQTDLPWPPRDVFQVAVRFVRVDRGCRVTDKDPDAGYVLFECDGDAGKPPKRGALELIATEVQGRPGVRAQVTLTDEPRYVELRFLELLERKLKDERGPALPPRPAPPAATSPDAGR